jgi:ABC-type transporter Mla subunit MlaD
MFRNPFTRRGRRIEHALAVLLDVTRVILHRLEKIMPAIDDLNNAVAALGGAVDTLTQNEQANAAAVSAELDALSKLLANLPTNGNNGNDQAIRDAASKAAQLAVSVKAQSDGLATIRDQIAAATQAIIAATPAPSPAPAPAPSPSPSPEG